MESFLAINPSLINANLIKTRGGENKLKIVAVQAQTPLISASVVDYDLFCERNDSFMIVGNMNCLNLD